MESSNPEGAAAGLESLPPSPLVIPPNVVPIQAEPKKTHEPCKKTSFPKQVPMARLNYGIRGYKLLLLTNHFQVDEKKSLFTHGSLRHNKLEFTVVLDDLSLIRTSRGNSDGSPNETNQKRLRRSYKSKTFKVEISYYTKIPIKAIADALSGQESLNAANQVTGQDEERQRKDGKFRRITLEQEGAGTKGVQVQLQLWHPYIMPTLVLDKVQETYESELEGKSFAYDGERSLFTLGFLPSNRLEFTRVGQSLVKQIRIAVIVLSFCFLLD